MPNFQPQVNYNVPILETRPRQEIQRPDVNVQPIDISGMVKNFGVAAEKKQASEEAQAYEKLKSEYASKYDEIEAALSQGQINTSDADILKRSLSEESRIRGIMVDDDIKLRKNYGGPIEGLEKNRLEMVVKEQQEVLENQRKDIRDRFPQLRFADNNTIDSITYYVDSFGRDKEYYNNIINNPYSSEAERESAMLHLQDSVNEEAFFNTNMIAQQYMAAVSNSGEIDPNFRQQFLEGTTQQMMVNGADPTVARLTAEKLWDKTGLSTFYRLHEVDTEEATKFAKTVADNYETTLKQNGLKGLYDYSESHPGFASILQLPQGLQQNLPQQATRDVMNNFVTYTNRVVKGKGLFGMGQRTERKLIWSGDTGRSAVQGFNIALADPYATTESILGQRGATAEAFNNYTEEQDLYNMTNDDLVTTRDNAKTLDEQLNSAPAQNIAKKAANSKSRSNQALAEDSNTQLRKTKGIENAANLLINVEAPVKNLLHESSQADRLRYDPKTGEVMLTKDATFLQRIAQTFNDPKYYLDSINTNAAKSMTPDERVAMLERLGAKPLQPGEEAATFDGNWFVEGTRSVERSLNNAANRAEGALINSPVNKMFTGEETTTSTKVSNKTTVGGAWAGNSSAQALREYADRLEASVESVKNTGAKTERGKLENDMKLINEARAMADKLEGVTTTTSKVSNKTTIGGASFAKDLYAEGNPSKVTVKVEERINKRLEEIEKEQNQLINAGLDSSEEFRQLSTEKARLYKLLGEDEE